HRAATADAAHRQDARVVVAGAFFAVLAALTADLALRLLLVAGVIGLADVLVGRRLRILELADLVLVGAADLGARPVVALLRRVALALGFLLEVRLLRARFLGDAAVLVGQELRVVVGLVLDVLVVLDLDHRHVRRWLLRRRLLLLLRLLLRRWRQWRRR